MREDVSEKQHRLLIVDDQEEILLLIKDILTNEGYLIDTATSGSNALPLLVDNKYDLIISDINMPHLNGEELLNICNKQFQDSPIILITGQPDFNDAVQLIKKGAVDYIGKPFTPAELIKKAEDAIKSSEKKLSEIKNAADYKDGYKVIRHIGTGTHGDVLLVEKNDVEYAMKIIKLPNDDEASKVLLERFKTEFISMIKLDYPGIIKVFQFTSHDNGEFPYIIMEYAKGGSLAEFRDRDHEISEKILITQKIFEAIAYLHSNGIIHRDIKPENILLDTENNPKIADFGIAKLMDNSLTKTIECIGSPNFMAPEAFVSSKNVDLRSDLFALGSVIYELFTGHRAFSGKTMEEIARNITRKKPIEPKLHNNEIPTWVQLLLAGLLAKKPKQRFCNAEEVLEFIRKRSDESPNLFFSEKISFFMKKRHKIWK